MRFNEFSTLRRGLQSNAAPASDAVRVSVASVLEQALTDSGLFHAVEVGTAESEDRLVIALVGFRPDVSASEVSAGLEQLWRDRVGFGFWQAHTVLVNGADQVELQGASRSSSTAGFVTVHVVAQALEPAAAPSADLPAQEVRGARGSRERRGLLALVPLGGSRRAVPAGRA